MKFASYIAMLATAAVLSACDEGNIYPETSGIDRGGATAKFVGYIANADSWPSQYTLSIAAFSDDSDYAKTAKNISVDDDGYASVTLTGIDVSYATVEVCVISKLRARVYTFLSVELSEYQEGDTICFEPSEAIETDMFDCVQSVVFENNCTRCHGGNGYYAGDLNLTEGNSYSALVNVASTRDADGALLVVPSYPDSSYLYRVICGEEDEVLGMTHYDILSNDYVATQLVKNWISAGAVDN